MNKIFQPKFPWNHRLGAQLMHIKGAIKSIDCIEKIDFCQLDFSPPLLAVFYATQLSQHSTIDFDPDEIGSYLCHIYFPNGINPNQNLNWEDILCGYEIKTYLPIIKFNTAKSITETEVRESIISHLGKMIRKITKIPVNYYSAISYLLSELTDNIVDHSRHDFGWISFQYYPTSGFMDICLADTGVGVLGSYRAYEGEQDYTYVDNDLKAIDRMIKGDSTKMFKERGFGVHTSRSMLVNGLKGHFIYLSGNGLLIDFDLMNFGESFQGSMALLRIPVSQQVVSFQYTDYLE